MADDDMDQTKKKSFDRLFKENKTKLEIKDVDLSVNHEEIFLKIKAMQKLQLLKLEGCNLDIFEPPYLT